MTTRELDNLISQTEYGLAVTPIYDEGPGQPMIGEAITGKNHQYYNDIVDSIVYLLLTEIEIILTFPPLLCRCGSCPKEPAILRSYPDQLQSHLGARSP